MLTLIEVASISNLWPISSIYVQSSTQQTMQVLETTINHNLFPNNACVIEQRLNHKAQVF